MLKITHVRGSQIEIQVIFKGTKDVLTYQDQEQIIALMMLMDGGEKINNPQLQDLRDELYPILDRASKRIITKPEDIVHLLGPSLKYKE